MKVELERADLAKALAFVGKAIENRNTIPIIGCVVLELAGGCLTVTGTDLNVWASYKLVVDGEDGSAAIDAKILSNLVRSGSGQTVSLESDGMKLVVKCGRSRHKINILPAEDFPKPRAQDWDATFDIDLKSLVSSITYAQSNEETRYYLCGVHLFSRAGKVAAEATTGHILAQHISDCDAEFREIIVPHKTIGMLPDGEVSVSVNDSRIKIDLGNATLDSRLIAGSYPDTERVIPGLGAHIVTANVQELLKALGSVTAVNTNRHAPVKLEFLSGSIELSVRCDNGDARCDVEANYNGEPAGTGFNGTYLKETLSAISGDVTISIESETSPALLTSSELPNWRGVIMPLRV